MSLRDPYAQATYSGDNTEQHLFNRYIGVILTVAFGGMGVLYIVSGLLGLKFLVGTNGVESTNHPEALLFLAASGVLLVGGSIWGWVLAKRDWAEMIKARDAALAGPQLDAPAAHESVFDRGAAAQASGPPAAAALPVTPAVSSQQEVDHSFAAWTGWIPQSYVATGDWFAALVPSTIRCSRGEPHYLVGTAQGNRVWVYVRCTLRAAAGFVHDVETTGGGTVPLRFNVLPTWIGGDELRRQGKLTPPPRLQNSPHDPVEDAMARFVCDPAVLTELDSFDLPKYRAALDVLIKNTTEPVERCALTRLRLTRRFFSAECSSVGTLFTWFGCGLRLVGEGDRLGKTHVATRWVSLFYLPVWPLRSFVVSEVGPWKYDFLSEVPTDLRYRWAALSIPGVALAVAIARLINGS